MLIDRLSPRGVPKAKARLDAWEKDIAPARGLREWYGHDHGKWPGFRARYTNELRTAAAKIILVDLVRRAQRGRIPVVYGPRAAETSDVVVLE